MRDVAVTIIQIITLSGTFQWSPSFSRRKKYTLPQRMSQSPDIDDGVRVIGIDAGKREQRDPRSVWVFLAERLPSSTVLDQAAGLITTSLCTFCGGILSLWEFASTFIPITFEFLGTKRTGLSSPVLHVTTLWDGFGGSRYDGADSQSFCRILVSENPDIAW